MAGYQKVGVKKQGGALIPLENGSFREAFDIRPGEVISLVGAGGKTTLMFSLARELAAGGKLVITTTTTKIFPPAPGDSPVVFISRDRDEMIDFIINRGPTHGHITVAAEKLASAGKLKGIEPDMVQIISGLQPVNHVIVEADGAARRPLKAPDTRFEPVIPANTSLLIPVVGLDALGNPLTEAHVFRSEIASILLDRPLGEIITEDFIAELLTHPAGICWNCPEKARIIPFLNKTDLDPGRVHARALAQKILRRGHPKMDRVVLGQAQSPEPVLEVVF